MSLWEKIRRPDWLAEMQALLIGGLVVVGVGIVVSGALTVADGGPLVAQVPAGAVSGLAGAADGLDRPAVIAPDALVEVEIADPTVRQQVASALASLPTGLLVLVVLALLLRIVRRARRDDPFTAGTVRQLRILAVVVLAGSALVSIVESLATLDLTASLTGLAQGWGSLPAAWFLAGFGLLAISEVVKRGTAMRAELDTVV